MAQTIIKSVRGEAFDWTFNITGQSTYPGIAAESQLRNDDGDLVATFDVDASDNNDNTASVHLALTPEVSDAIPSGHYKFDIKIAMTGWGPYFTPIIILQLNEPITKDD